MPIHRTRMAAVALAALAIVLPITRAGDDKPVPESVIEPDGRLLMNRKVLKEIKCDIDQLDRLLDVLEEADRMAQRKINEAVQKQINQNPGNQAFDFGKVMQEANLAGEEEFKKIADAAIKDTLTAAQRKRLSEIDLQVRGYEAFMTPEIARKLELTREQKVELEKNADKVQAAVAQALGPGMIGGQAGGVFGGGQGGAGRPGRAGGQGGQGLIPAAITEYLVNQQNAILDARAEGLKQALATLTDEQRATWKKLVGEPFTPRLFFPKWRVVGLGMTAGAPVVVPPSPGK